MKHESGMVHVHVFWLIAALLLMAAGWFAFYAVLDEKTGITDKLKAAEEAKDKADQTAEEVQENLSKLSAKVGFRDETAAGSVSNLDVIDAKIKELQTNPDYAEYIKADTATLASIIPAFEAAVKAKSGVLSEREGKVRDLTAEVEKANKDRTDVEAQKDQTLNQYREQLRTAQEDSDRQKQQDQATIDGLRTQVQTLQDQVNQTKADAAKKERDLGSQLLTLEGRIKDQGKKLEILRPEDKPDGRVINVSPSLGYIYVDLGARNRAQGGLRFAVYQVGKGGEYRHKGWVRIREVYEDYAKAGVEQEFDKLDPIVAGDIIVNQLYDRNRPLVFAMLGRFRGRFNNNELKQLLLDRGATVQDKVSSNTDFLLLGEAEDPDGGEDLTKAEEYRKAQQFGVQVLTMRDIAEFIKY